MSVNYRAVSNDCSVEKYSSAPTSVRTTVSGTVPKDSPYICGIFLLLSSLCRIVYVHSSPLYIATAPSWTISSEHK